MSIKVMTMVFDRYPAGGNERLLALALADHARDDGTRIWPSVAELARKTVLSRSTVQRLIRSMLERGWLEQVHTATGRPGDTNEYRVNATWMAGGNLPERGVKLTPLSAEETGTQPVDNVIHTGVKNGGRGVKNGGEGCHSYDTRISMNRQEPYTPPPPVHTGGSGKPERPKTEAQQPKPDSRSTRKPGWRWRETWDGVCKRGQQLGVPYSAAPLGNAWTDKQLRQHQAAYRQLVEAAHAAQQDAGPAVSTRVMAALRKAAPA